MSPHKLSGLLLCVPQKEGVVILPKKTSRGHKGELTGCTGTCSWKDFRICLPNAARKAEGKERGGVLPVFKAYRLGRSSCRRGQYQQIALTDRSSRSVTPA